MAVALTKNILRRRKASLFAENYNGPVFPLRELPYELQLMIGHECVLSSVPIIIGKSATKWHLDAEEELEARFARSMLAVSRDFREELYRTFYEENSFELGYYYNQTNFFRQPGAKLVQYVVVDALRVLVQPVGVPSTVADNLKMLPNLKQVSIRLRGSFSNNASRYESALPKFLSRLAQVLPLETIELLIEPILKPDVEGDEKLQGYKDFLDQTMTVESIWPNGKPAEKRDIIFRAEWLHVSGSTLERHASNVDTKPMKSRRITKFINSRRSSVVQDTSGRAGHSSVSIGMGVV